MKKNITINIFGQLYAFDEDAYELLKNYEDSLRSAFSSQPGGHEIADDIEARIAELLNELKANGVEAITIEHVQDIIKRIGTPEDITGNDDETTDNGDATATEQNGQNQSDNKSDINDAKPAFSLKNKRLYRDANNKMLAGVLGGLAGYFNQDATFWRIGYAVLLAICLFADFSLISSLSGFLIIGYVILAILLPVAKTPEDRLRMKGMEITPQNLAQEVVDDSRRNEVRNENQEVVNKAGGCILKGCLVSIALMLIIPLVLVLIAFFALLFLPAQLADFQIFDGSIGEMLSASTTGTVIMLICLILGFLIIIYCIFHAIMSNSGKVKPMGFKQRLFWLVAWFVCFSGLIASLVWIGERVAGMAYKLNRHPGIHIKVDEITRGSMNGIELNEDDWDYFNEEDFELIKAEKCDGGRYTFTGQHFTGDDDDRYFDAYNINGGIVYHAQKRDYVTPGLYRLTAVARTDRTSDNAVFIFAQTEAIGDSVADVGQQTDDSVVVKVGGAVKVSVGRHDSGVRKVAKPNASTQLVAVPAYGDEGGLLKEQLKKMAESHSLPEWVDDDYDDILEANNGNGYGWSIVTIDSIRVGEGQKVVYGVTTDPAFNGGHSMTGKWFSACEFHLDRIGD